MPDDNDLLRAAQRDRTRIIVVFSAVLAVVVVPTIPARVASRVMVSITCRVEASHPISSIPQIKSSTRGSVIANSTMDCPLSRRLFQIVCFTAYPPICQSACSVDL